jgi:flavin-dependent dehydrogenase
LLLETIKYFTLVNVNDVIVIGAGLSGLQIARLLGARGLRVLLVDRKASVADGVQTTGIFVRKTWEDFPLPDEQLGAGIRDVVLYSPQRRAMRLRAKQDEFRIGRMSWLMLWMLEQCSRAGVTWMPSTRVLSCEPLRDATLVTLERRGRREQIATRFVVGADGPRSFVAKQFGLDRNREFLVGVEDVVPSRGGSEPALHCFLDPRIAPGYIAWVADDGVEAHAGVAGYRNRFEPITALRAFRASIPELIDPHAVASERRGGLIPVNGILRRIADRHALLVGDAAGAVSPLTAGGLDPAMRLSTYAADVLVRHFDGDVAALHEYSGAHFAPRFIARRWMRAALRAVGSVPMAELACALLRTPPLRALAEHVFYSRGSFPDAPMHLTDPSPSGRGWPTAG